MSPNLSFITVWTMFLNINFIYTDGNNIQYSTFNILKEYSTYTDGNKSQCQEGIVARSRDLVPAHPCEICKSCLL